TVPSGALGSPQKIVVRELRSTGRIALQAPGETTSKAYPAGSIDFFVFEPSKLTFIEPVTVDLPLASSQTPGAAFLLVDGRVLFLPAQSSNGIVHVTTSDLAFTGAERAQVMPGAMP